MSAGLASTENLPRCPRCGQPVTAASMHLGCVDALGLEPPRYCADCGRRMVVQVTPAGWTARCSEHGLKQQ